MIKPLGVICLTIVVILFSPHISKSWWTQTHPKISQLSGLYYAQTITRTEIGDQYYAIFINTVRDPDDNKALDHYLRAKPRAVDAFNASLNEFKNGNYKNAVTHLAHSFHYIQDIGDSSKKMDDLLHDSREEYIRQMADSMALTAINDKDWRYFISSYSTEISSLNLSQTLEYLQDKRRGLRDTMNAIFRDYSNSPGELHEILRWEVLKTLALIAATQNHVVDIYCQNTTLMPNRFDRQILPPNTFKSQAVPRPRY